MAFFFKHLNLSGTTHNRLYREDNLEIPYDALREAVVNAYCHMQWGYEIATVGIAIYDDCIVIENAGRFPVRISPNTLMRKEEEDRKNTSESGNCQCHVSCRPHRTLGAWTVNDGKTM